MAGSAVLLFWWLMATSNPTMWESRMTAAVVINAIAIAWVVVASARLIRASIDGHSGSLFAVVYGGFAIMALVVAAVAGLYASYSLNVAICMGRDW
jgi:hypothetical protein